MNMEKLKTLENLLHEYFEELDSLYDANYYNNNEIIAITDAIEKSQLEGGRPEVTRALESEYNKLEQVEETLRQKYYSLTDTGDIKSLIEDINDLWW